MPRGGDCRLGRVPLLPSCHLPVPARRQPRTRPLPCRSLVHQKASPWSAERYNAAHPSCGHQHTKRICSDPASRSYAEMTIPHKPTESTWIGCSTLSHGCVPPGTRSRSSTGSTKPTTSRRPTRRWHGSPIVNRSVRHRPDPRIPRDRGHDHRLARRRYSPTTPADEHPTDPSRISTTCSRSYDESLTDSRTTATTQPADCS